MLKIVGKDFPNVFSQDLFPARRMPSGNPYDPESLLTGAEVEAGMTYTNSRRAWATEAEYHRAVQGEMTTEEILEAAPRVRIN